MKKPFLFFGCLFSIILLQVVPLLGQCGCGKKEKSNEGQLLYQNISFKGGCGCGGGVGKGTNEIPPDAE